MNRCKTLLACGAAITLATGAHAMRLLKMLLILCVCAAGPAVAQRVDKEGFLFTGPVRDQAEWLRLAEQGNADAQYWLGLYYYAKAQTDTKEYPLAAAWYRKAAEQGDPDAQFNLGAMYDKGQGVPQDYETALSLYRKAAEQGYTEAQRTLGGMYAEGRGAPQDFVQAHMWYNLAAVRSDGRAADYDRAERNRTAMKMTPAQIAEAQKLAREWKPKPQR